MFKRGFTLAEILITLGIIGIVAAMTIPTLVANGKNQANASTLSSTISDIENALTVMLANESAEDLSETNAFSNTDDFDTFVNYLNNYIKISATEADNKTFYTNAGYSAPVYLDNTTSVPTGYNTVMLKNGAIIAFNLSPSAVKDEDAVEKNGLPNKIASISIDVNGASKPNICGRDFFAFEIGANGTLYPYGGREVSIYTNGDTSAIWTNEDGDYPCTNAVKSLGQGCTARLIQNNFKMDY